MPISKLKLTNLGPFDKVEFEFDPQVTVLVGPNNCGKSTALIALGDLCVYDVRMLDKLLRPGSCTYFIRGDAKRGMFCEGRGVWKRPIPDTRGRVLPESWGYTVFIPALRWGTDYRSEGPAQVLRRKDPGKGAKNTIDMPARAHAESDEQVGGAALVRDSQIVQTIVDLDYRAYRINRPRVREVFNKITSVASDITEGFPLEFAGVAEDERGLYPQFVTPDGKVPLDVLSQGTQSLIQWLARLLIGYAEHYDFPASLDDKPGILIIDEIDAHLHPSWQRRIIPAITKEFPSLQIFCSTHSPLMLAGLKAGQIHLLKRDKKGKVTVSRNETDIVGWSADEIVTTFLGVDSATDFQTEQDIKRLQELRDKTRLSAKEREELERLRGTVNRALLSGAWIDDVEGLAARLATPQGKKPPKKAAKKEPTSRKKTSSRPSKRTTPSSKKRTKK